YQFTSARSTADVSGYTYTHGFISSITGIESSHEKNIITSSYITVYPAMTYEFEDTGDNPDISYWWIYEYDDSNNFIKAYATNAEAPSKHHIFKPSGSRIRLMANAKSGVTLNIDRKSTRLNSSHVSISCAVGCLRETRTREPTTVLAAASR